jgi:hypothetical protein
MEIISSVGRAETDLILKQHNAADGKQLHGSTCEGECQRSCAVILLCCCAVVLLCCVWCTSMRRASVEVMRPVGQRHCPPVADDEEKMGDEVYSV